MAKQPRLDTSRIGQAQAGKLVMETKIKLDNLYKQVAQMKEENQKRDKRIASLEAKSSSN